jgi:hypothetical protein
MTRDRTVRSGRRRALAVCVLALLAVATLPVLGQTELVLIDGRVLKGKAVRRDGGEYVLTLESGDEISLPAELVRTVRLGEGPKRPEPEKRDDGRTPGSPPGFRRAEPETLAGAPPPEGPSGLRESEPHQLAGEPVRPPTVREQRGTLGEAARFQKDIVKNDWQPTTDWNMDPELQNNWAPSKWAEDIVDNSWKPESAWNAEDDVLKDSRSSWRNGPVDSSWKPTDGFKK